MFMCRWFLALTFVTLNIPFTIPAQTITVTTPINLGLVPGLNCYDVSWATVKDDKSDSGFYFWTTDGAGTPSQFKYWGTPEIPYQKLIWTTTHHDLIDFNGFAYQASHIFLQNIYKVNDTEYVNFSHIERATPNVPTYAIGTLYSANAGEHWTFCGEMIQPYCNTTGDKGNSNIGGVPYLVVGDYFYVYFNDWRTSNSSTQQGLCVARAKVVDVIAAARNHTVPVWKKYTSGTWDQDGMTGLASGLRPGGQLGDSHSDAHYNRALGKYVLTFQANGAVNMCTSTDGIAWTDMRRIGTGCAYAFHIGLRGSADCHEIGKNFNIFWAENCCMKMMRARVLITVTDSTPPSMPGTPTTTAVNESRILLNWAPAVDSQSRVAYYKIYRDGVKIRETDTTAFTDTGLTSIATYRYEISAVNWADKEGAKTVAVSATTLHDLNPPRLVAAHSWESTVIRLTFDKPVNEADAKNPGNYGIDKGITVAAAVLDQDLRTVILATAALTLKTDYTITVAALRDRAEPPNTIGTDNHAVFQYYPGVTKIRFLPRKGFGNWMTGGIFEGSNGDQFAGPYVPIDSIAGPVVDSVWNTLATPAHTDQAYRYLRYRGPAGGYGNVTEIEFYRGPDLLTGVPFATPGGQDTAVDNNAFDGSIYSYYYYQLPTGAYTGIDIGQQGSTALKELQKSFSWVPRAGMGLTLRRGDLYFSLPDPVSTKLVIVRISDVRGRLVRTVTAGRLGSVWWANLDGALGALPSGHYLVSVKAGHFFASSRISVVR